MSKKLLLADDSITIQKVIQITFAHEDYELTITDNGDAAFAKALEIKPDLVMADVYMPGKNGYELTTAIKQEPTLQRVPVLLLAGSFEPFDEDKARSCKADAWIEKPFESQSLIDKVAELLSAAHTALQPAATAPEPAVAAEPASPEPDWSAFEEPLETEQEVPASAEDPFGDISFEEEPAGAVVEPVSAADDWSDVILEPAVETLGGETFTGADVPETEIEEDFSFTEETPDTAEPLAPVAESGFDSYDMGEEEIMPLDDDDILGAEDLEPVMEEQTLAPWSRAETGGENFFDDPLETAQSTEMPFSDEPPVFAGETPAFAEEAPAFAEEAPAFAEETPAFAEETPAFAEAQPAAAVVTEMDIEAKASALGEHEIEQILEKVVTKVVERLAGTILEKVAWEVVPGLAENLIREEIRKIKDAAA